MVEVVDGHSAGDGIVVLALPVLEHGMEGEDGKLLLQFRLQGFILFFGQPASLVGFQRVFYLGSDAGYMSRIECLVQEGGRAFPHLTAYIVCYSETHFF